MSKAEQLSIFGFNSKGLKCQCPNLLHDAAVEVQTNKQSTPPERKIGQMLKGCLVRLAGSDWPRISQKYILMLPSLQLDTGWSCIEDWDRFINF